ncbi:Uncharacterized protein NV38_0002692 [Leptospira kirschneri serovar Mozdok]|nr:Uncharacterized protein NV38_0002692 [Leptospira kirschneri serovar Mozdok]NDK04132.1 hypothetical protein [Leptospira kirschneri serovar Mozdok]
MSFCVNLCFYQYVEPSKSITLVDILDIIGSYLSCSKEIILLSMKMVNGSEIRPALIYA